MNEGHLRRQKVMLVSNCTWNLYNFWMELVQRLHNQGYEVIVSASRDEYAPLVEQSTYCRFVPLQSLRATSTNLGDEWRCWRELYLILVKEKPDVLFTFTIKPNIYGCLLAKMLNIKVLPTVTGLGYTFLHPGLLNQVTKRLYHRAFHKVPNIIFHNQRDYLLFQEERLIEPQQGIVVAGAGVNTAYYAAAPEAQMPPFVFLYLGRILSDKGIKELASAAANIRKERLDVEIWIAGFLPENHPAGIDKKLFQSWIDQGIIRYWGPVNDVRPLIRQAKVLVLPSYREGLSSSVLEAMSMARPLIVTDVPGCSETVVPQWNGWRVQPRNATDLEKYMRIALNTDAATLHNMGMNSRKKAIEEFNIEQVHEVYMNFLGKAEQVATPSLVL